MFFTDGYTFILHWWIFSLVYSWWILIDIYNTFKWTVPSLIYSYICVQDHHQSIFLLSISVKTASRQALRFRESAEMLNPTNKSLQSVTQELRLLIEHRIPIIAHQSANLKDLFIDKIHFCEPALQLAWLTTLMHIVNDWNRKGTFRTSVVWFDIRLLFIC